MRQYTNAQIIARLRKLDNLKNRFWLCAIVVMVFLDIKNGVDFWAVSGSILFNLAIIVALFVFTTTALHTFVLRSMNIRTSEEFESIMADIHKSGKPDPQPEKFTKIQLDVVAKSPNTIGRFADEDIFEWIEIKNFLTEHPASGLNDAQRALLRTEVLRLEYFGIMTGDTYPTDHAGVFVQLNSVLYFKNLEIV